MLEFVLDICFFFFKQKTAYEMRISDWSSDVCSSDLFGFDCRRQNRSGQLLCVIACNPDAVITCDLAAMHTAKFAQFDVAGWNSLAGANDDGPAFGRFDCCPGPHPAAGQPVELPKGFHCSDPKFLGTPPAEIGREPWR